MKLAKIFVCVMFFISFNVSAFDSSLLEHKERVGLGIVDDETLVLSPGLGVTELGVNHDVAISKTFDFNGGDAGTLEIKAEFNSSVKTDDVTGVLRQLSFGGADSVVKAQYLYKKNNLYIGGGFDVSDWEYNVKLAADTVVNESSFFATYNVNVEYKVDGEWYVGLKVTQYDVLSDSDMNSIEKKTNGATTTQIRALFPYPAQNGSKVWVQADVIAPLGDGDPVFMLGMVANFNAL